MALEHRNLPSPFGRMMRWNEIMDPFDRLREDMQALAGRYATSGGNGEPEPMLVSYDAVETENAYEFTLDVPGVKRDELSIDFHDGRLTVSGKRQREETDKGKTFHRLQRSFGTFQTSFALPGDVDADKIDARLKDGVLTLSVPKSEAARKKARKIAVKSA